MSPEELEAIEARANAATEGPWHWSGNTDVQNIFLATWKPGLGRCTVMDAALRESEKKNAALRMRVKNALAAIEPSSYYEAKPHKAARDIEHVRAALAEEEPTEKPRLVHVTRQEVPWPPHPEATYMLSRFRCSCGWSGAPFRDSLDYPDDRDTAAIEAREHVEGPTLDPYPLVGNSGTRYAMSDGHLLDRPRLAPRPEYSQERADYEQGAGE